MNPAIAIQPHSFGNATGNEDVLVLSINERYFSFCEFEIVNTTPTRISHFLIEDVLKTSTTEQLFHSIKHFKINATQYKKIYINYSSALFTLCPVSFYKPEHARELLEFNVGSTTQHVILNDDVTSEVKLIYAVESDLKSTLDKLFPQHQLHHSLSVLSKLALNSDELKNQLLVIQINSNTLEVVLKDNNQLTLVNQYSVNSNEDVLYFILFILEQYQLNPLTVNIAVAGNISTDDTLILTLKKYIKHIKLVVGHKSIVWKNIEGMPQHFNYLLLNRLFCE